MCRQRKTVKCPVLLDWLILERHYRKKNFWSQIQDVWGPLKEIQYLQYGEIFFKKRKENEYDTV